MSGRVVAVDVMRGLTMAAMIVVNNPGSWAHMAPLLQHAAWGGWLRPADFVFPFFLFLVGVATPLALHRRRERGDPASRLLLRAMRRAAVLFAIGVFLNLFPQFDLATVRVPGVLQRIAMVYLGCAAAFLRLRPRSVAALVAVLLVGYTLVLRLVPVPGVGGPVLAPDVNLPVWLDDGLFGAHTWRGAGDPEGLLSTLGALATGLIGVLAGTALVGPATPRRQATMFGVSGALLLALGGLAMLAVPAVKELWTASYALLTAGPALLVLAALQWWLGERDVQRTLARRVLGALTLMGRQALLAYVLAHLVSDLSIHVVRWPTGADGAMRSLHTLVYRGLLTPWLPPAVASLAYSLIVLAFVWALVAWLDRRGLRLRV